jgi:hypothetical protein
MTWIADPLATPSSIPSKSKLSSPQRPKLSPSFALPESQRDYAHPDQVGAMNALERLGNDRHHAEQRGPFGCPIAAAARTVVAAGENNRGNPLVAILLRGIEDGHDPTIREVLREAAFGAFD